MMLFLPIAPPFAHLAIDRDELLRRIEAPQHLPRRAFVGAE